MYRPWNFLLVFPGHPRCSTYGGIYLPISTGAGFLPSTVLLPKTPAEKVWLGCDIGGAKEPWMMYFPAKWGDKEPQNPRNYRVDDVVLSLPDYYFLGIDSQFIAPFIREDGTIFQIGFRYSDILEINVYIDTHRLIFFTSIGIFNPQQYVKCLTTFII